MSILKYKKYFTKDYLFEIFYYNITVSFGVYMFEKGIMYMLLVTFIYLFIDYMFEKYLNLKKDIPFWIQILYLFPGVIIHYFITSKVVNLF